MEEKELLDYCRVKKISDKGYGFLTSLYYDQNVFFHFNGIKDPAVKEKLEKQKRGDIYFFYTSTSRNGKRRVNKLWLNVSEIDKKLIPQFVERISKEFISGKTNPFEVAFVIKQLRENGYFNSDRFIEVITSEKLLKTPSILMAMLTDNELDRKAIFEQIVSQLESNEIDATEWAKKIPTKFSRDFHS